MPTSATSTTTYNKLQLELPRVGGWGAVTWLTRGKWLLAWTEAKMSSWVALLSGKVSKMHAYPGPSTSLRYPAVTDSVLRSIQKNVLGSPGALVAENDIKF